MAQIFSFTNSLDRMNRSFPTEPGYGHGFRGLGMLRGMGDNGVIVFDDGSTYNTATGQATPATDGSSGAATQDWTQSIASVAPNVLQSLKDLWVANRQADLQSQLVQLNMQLVAAGKPPITADMIGSLSPQVNVGLSSDTKQLLTYGGIALLFIMLFKRSR